MIQLYIVQTGKGYAPKAPWQTLCDERVSFADMKEANEYLAERYGKCKRKKMFVDTKDGGKSKHVGYVFCFRADDISHCPVQKWIQNDWVEFQEVTAISPA